MEINLKEGVNLKIEGALGEHQSLSIEDLVSISQSLQDLILNIAKFDLPSDVPIDLNNFKIELSGFSAGSAIPSYCYTHKVNPSLFGLDEQREKVSQKFNSLMNISSNGAYSTLKDVYPEPIIRNEIVESLYGFTSSFKNSPVRLYGKGSNVTNAYSIKKFKTELKKELISKIEEITEEGKEELALAKIKLTVKGGKKTQRIKEVFPSEQYSLSYSPISINVGDKEYRLNYPLRCLMEKEDGFYVITHEAINLIGTGTSKDEAIVSFNEEFSYLYDRLNSLPDENIGKSLLNAKFILNIYVKEVI